MRNQAKRTGARDKPVDQRRPTADWEIVAPADPDTGVLGRAVQAGDYKAFRSALSGYEEWLRKRVGRWLQRYPEAEARIGRGLAIGDVVEEAYLHAYEHYGQRPTEVPFHQWLEGLIDPSWKVLVRHPEEERENASLARTLRETPLK
jgi:DNA-directed RNA polymerase specialized sigma24 family protein